MIPISSFLYFVQLAGWDTWQPLPIRIVEIISASNGCINKANSFFLTKTKKCHAGRWLLYHRSSAYYPTYKFLLDWKPDLGNVSLNSTISGHVDLIWDIFSGLSSFRATFWYYEWVTFRNLFIFHDSETKKNLILMSPTRFFDEIADIWIAWDSTFIFFASLSIFLWHVHFAGLFIVATAYVYTFTPLLTEQYITFSLICFDATEAP